MGNTLRALWGEPRPPQPPARVWRDWALLATVIAGSFVEAMLRADRTGLVLVVAVSLVIALSLLWRRTAPLASVTVAFGALIAFEVARIVAVDATGLFTIGAALVLPYALLRWGAGREAVIGLSIIFAWLILTHLADPTPIGEAVAGYGFFLFSAALGASIRYHASARTRDIAEAKLRQRNELARELHDNIGHHVSGIAIQAQAGRALADSHPERALAVLETIEEAASRALEEMRAMVGVLRDAGEADLAPQPSVADIERLAQDLEGAPRVEVHLSGSIQDLPPSVATALYRIAQEAVTNSLRHARNATRATVEVRGDVEWVRLTVLDDGDATAAGDPTATYGLTGMGERAALLGGTLQAGPSPHGGWTVEAVLPKAGPGSPRPQAAHRSTQT